MKNIIVPTDFSVNAGYALNYAAEYANTINATITIVHIFNIPVLTDAAVIDQSMIDHWQKDNKKALFQISERVLSKHSNLKIETESILGFTSDEILALTATHKYAMIIMGSKGNSDVGGNVFGNTTSNIIRTSKIPVLVIPPGLTYKPIQRVALACHKDELLTEKVVREISDFIGELKAKMYILDIVRELAEPISKSYEETNKIKSHFNALSPSVHIIEDEKVVHGINDFGEENEIDIVIMIPEKHTLFERLFTEIHTIHMARSTNRPLLVLSSEI
jgi:nucleotide-binding universal stress UspA family protein